MSEKRYSQDSQSSGTESRSKNHHKVGIKSRILKKKPVPLQQLELPTHSSGNLPNSARLAEGNLNNSFLSFTEYSDSDSSTFDSGKINNVSLHKLTVDEVYNPMDVKPKKYFHQYAEKQTPYQEWGVTFEIVLETFYQVIAAFYLYILSNFCGIIYWALEGGVLTLLAIPCLLYEYTRTCIKKSRKAAQKTKKKETPFLPTLSTGKKDLQIVLDLDKALILITQERPASKDQNYFKVARDQKSASLYVYKRPSLEKFLKDIAAFGTIHAFTTVQQKIADFIIDELDPKGLIKHRYYQENLNLIDATPMIQINPKKLVLVLSSEESEQKREILNSILGQDQKVLSNLAKKNTIKLSEWSKEYRGDKALEDCADIIEQLSYATDVSKDLKCISDQFNQLN